MELHGIEASTRCWASFIELQRLPLGPPDQQFLPALMALLGRYSL